MKPRKLLDRRTLGEQHAEYEIKVSFFEWLGQRDVRVAVANLRYFWDSPRDMEKRR
jgi:hypothetical protein